MGKPRVLLADDHTLVAEAFSRLLEPQFEVVGTASDGRALLEKAVQLKPDVILLDLSKIAADVLRRWASGFLLKKSASAELVKAIQQVLKDKTFVTSHMTQNLLDRFVRDADSQKSKSLTPRQREVLQLLAEGRTMKEAADVLQVTARTVAFHKYKIMEEFELKTNSDLLRFAIRERIIS